MLSYEPSAGRLIVEQVYDHHCNVVGEDRAAVLAEVHRLYLVA